jgi:mannose-6-phosphate isomerase-like protein (cupin superfamily)
MVFKATSATTDGRFSLMERHLPPGGRMPPAHRHVDCVEAFFVLFGEVTFVLDGRLQTRGAGSFVLVAHGGSHTFGNRGPEPASLLVLHTPAMDAYFAELELLWSRREAPSSEEELALMARHGMEPA